MVGAAVVKVQLLVLASVPPATDFVPAGTVTEYRVDIGKRLVGSKVSVRGPNQRHLPGGCGESCTGTLAAASSCEVSATIGRENVIVNCGASGTSPSGEYRSTSSGSLVVLVLGGTASFAGNGTLIVLPVRGGGNDRWRKTNSCSSRDLNLIGAILLRMFAVSYSESGVVFTILERGLAGGWLGASLKRNCNPGSSPSESSTLGCCLRAVASGATVFIRRQNTTNREKTRIDRFILFVL